MLEELKEILYKYNPDVEITEDTSLSADLQMDSFAVIQLMIEVEDQFHVTIKERELSEMIMVSDIIKCLEEKK